jgi:hypothetical protein
LRCVNFNVLQPYINPECRVMVFMVKVARAWSQHFVLWCRVPYALSLFYVLVFHRVVNVKWKQVIGLVGQISRRLFRGTILAFVGRIDEKSLNTRQSG